MNPRNRTIQLFTSHHPRQKKNQEVSARLAPCTAAWTLNTQWLWRHHLSSEHSVLSILQHYFGEPIYWHVMVDSFRGVPLSQNPQALLRSKSMPVPPGPCCQSPGQCLSPIVLEVACVTMLKSAIEYNIFRVFREPLSSKGERTWELNPRV